VGDPALGFVVRPELAPERLPALAREVEAAGFEELWLWEDCFLGGGIASAGAALAATERIAVGLGILPAPVRNAAFAAMEIAALARIYPGRILPGFGHGPADWMGQVGAKPKSQLTLLEETVTAVKALLSGEEVDVDGRYVRLDRVRLDHPPEVVPPVYTGVRRERSLALSGRVADGTILAELASVPYIEWARAQIAATRPHRLTVYALWGRDRAEVQPAIEERIGHGGPAAERLDMETAAVLGPAQVRALADAGADAVVLVPAVPEHADVPRAEELLP
jgi:5,10-methylenetetrahydromethanopterin reductase